MTPSSDVILPASANDSKAREKGAELLKTAAEADSFDAVETLGRNPELRDCKSVVLDLAYEEYCKRVEAGESVDAESFAARFPTYQQSVLRTIEVDRYIQLNPSLVPDAPDLRWVKEGDSFLEFELVEELGRGALSRVFLATQPSLADRHVVVKICALGEYEAQFLGRLEHRGIVPVHSIQEEKERQLFAICMPFLSRTTLFDVLDVAFRVGEPAPSSGQVLIDAIQMKPGDDLACEDQSRAQLLASLPYADAIAEIGIQLTDALIHTHAKGVHHCDIKPSNVLLTPDGSAKLFDFNLSAIADDFAIGPGGTLEYMSPEQLTALSNPEMSAGEEAEAESVEIDHRTDIFSLGATLYQMLCGRMPFGLFAECEVATDSVTSILERQKNGPIPLRQVNPDVPEALARIVESCVAFDRELRPGSAIILKSVLQEYQSTRQAARDRRRTRPQRVARGVVIASCIAVVLGLVFLNSVDNKADSRPVPELPGANSTPVDEHLAMASRAFEAHSFKDAVDEFDRVLARNPENVDALVGRGRSRIRLFDFLKAIDDLRAASQVAGTLDIDSCLAYAMLLEYDRASDGTSPDADLRTLLSTAVGLNRNAMQQGVDTPAVRNNLAYGLLSIQSGGNSNEATAILEAVAAEFPDLQAVQINLAWLALSELQASKRDVETTVAHVANALDSSTDDAGLLELHYLAYGIFSRIARDDPTTPDEIRAAERVLFHFREYVRLGGQLRISKILFSSHPNYEQEIAKLRQETNILKKEIANSSRKNPGRALQPRLLDPLDEVNR